MLRHLIPFYSKSGTMCTENGIGWMLQIPYTVISNGSNDSLCIVTRRITAQHTAQSSHSMRIVVDLTLVPLHFRNGCFSSQNSQFAHGFRPGKGSVHALNVRNGTPDTIRWKLQPKLIPWLQQNRFGLHQSLANRAIRCLPEISTFCMLLMRTPCHQCEFNICQR